MVPQVWRKPGQPNLNSIRGFLHVICRDGELSPFVRGKIQIQEHFNLGMEELLSSVLPE